LNTKQDPNRALLIAPAPPGDPRAHKDHVHRIGTFADWLTRTHRRWDQPDLADYRAYMLDERKLAPSTVNVHLATIRARYRVLLEAGTLEAELQRLAEEYPPEERQPVIDAALARIKEAIHPAATRVEVRPPEVKHLYLADEQVRQLLDSPGTGSLMGLRDTALLALLVTTGIRTNEACLLDVPDLDAEFHGQPALHIPAGRGSTERLVPYGGLIWGRECVEDWLKAARIEQGPVFRGFYRGAQYIRPRRLTPTTLDNLLASYPIDIDGKPVIIRAMDLRRVYARTLYRAGLNLAAIAANLGLKNIGLVRDYLGPELDDSRVPPVDFLLEK
jgi:site-specific recombinase XerD